MSVAKAPWGDVEDEFTARSVPHGHNHIKSGESDRGVPGDLRRAMSPSAEGYQMGRQRAPIARNFLVDRLEMWNDFLNEKLRIVEVEIIDLQERTGGVTGAVFHPLMLVLAFAACMVLFVAVLAIDYAVVNEFYSNVYSNQYGEVPESRTISVLVKSLQVVAAALIFHFFFQMLTVRWRKIYTAFIFLLTMLLLVGIGVQNAYTSLPEEQTQDTVNEDRSLLESLGLAPEGGGEEAGAADESATTSPAQGGGGEWFKRNQGLFWFLSMSVLFVVVTSVAAMVLHVGLRALAGLTGRIDNEYKSDRSVMNKRDMRIRLARAHRVRDWLVSEKRRVATLGNALSWFREGYMYGLGRISRRDAREAEEGAEGDERRDGSTASLIQRLDIAVETARHELRERDEQWVIDDVAEFDKYDRRSEREKRAHAETSDEAGHAPVK